MTQGLRPTGKVLPEHGRAHNRAMILQHLFHAGPHSRADLARTTGLTRVTVSDLVASLMDEGIVVDLGPEARTNKVGKPATLVGLRTDAYQIVAVDLMDSEAMHGGVLDLNGRIATRLTRTGVTRPGQEGIDDLVAFCRELISQAVYPVLGIGIGSPGVVDGYGTVVQASNRDWTDLDLPQILSDALGVPAHVANDANAAALGEFTFGGAVGDGLLCLTIGQGVGSGTVLDGALVLGHANAAGELGHVTVVDERDAESGLGPALPCACGRRGCLETILSVPALRRRIAGLSPEATDAALASVGRRLGTALAPVVSTLNLSEVVLNGPAVLLGGPLSEAALEAIRERTLPVVSRGLKVRMTSLGEDGALAGAAVLVLSGQLGVT